MTVLGSNWLKTLLPTIIPLGQDRLTCAVQPASIDLTLASEFKILRTTPWLSALGITPIYYNTVIDGGDRTLNPHANLGVFTVRDKHNQLRSVYGYRLVPYSFVLGRTNEHIEIPNNLVGRLEGKSGIARAGVIIHTTAGYLDPGYKGRPTLEIANLSEITYILPIGMRICQLALMRCEGVGEGYVGSYQGSDEVMGSMYELVPESESVAHHVVDAERTDEWSINKDREDMY